MAWLQCFDAVGWVKHIWPVKKPEWWGAGVVICLGRGADLHMSLGLSRKRAIKHVFVLLAEWL